MFSVLFWQHQRERERERGRGGGGRGREREREREREEGPNPAKEAELFTGIATNDPLNIAPAHEGKAAKPITFVRRSFR